VFLDGRPVGVLEREHHDHAIVLPAARRAVLDVLVEDQGRVDYGPRIGEPKGLIGPVCIDGVGVGRWSVAVLDLDALHGAEAGAVLANGSPVREAVAGPAVAAGTLHLDEPEDLHLALDGFRKGVVWVNGFCLGRYWSRGPQRTLYVPGPVLRAGANEVVVLELHASTGREVLFLDEPDLGHTEA
jgi:beta-galactosidase